MKYRAYATALIFVLATAGAASAQSPTTGDPCIVTDYTCSPQPKGIGAGNTETGRNDPNAIRLRNELRTPPPISSTEPEEPEQPINSATEPEAPISNAR